MIVAQMDHRIHIIIHSDTKSSLAEIMSGYLQFYSNNTIDITLKSEAPVIHPLAEQVLKEDGIEYKKPTKSTGKSNSTHNIYINFPDTKANAGKNAKQFNFEDPLVLNDYEKVLTAFRATREAIKKVSIELVGEIAVIK